MKRSLRPCRQPGCPNLVEYGYCPEHQIEVKKISKEQSVLCLRKLDKKKEQKEIDFYLSPPWRRTSRLYRLKHPLCERCESRGYYRKSELVHHKKELRDIWRDGGNPLKLEYLEGLCKLCHLEDLRKKKNKNKNNNQYKY